MSKEEKRIYNAAIYIRLSKDDVGKGESDSVTNQRELLKIHIDERTDIRMKSIRIDDGYSGVNFDRPAFKAMIDDVKKGEIDCVVVKDLSRLGRNYIETGFYIEKIFPFLAVRFISINDNIDTSKEGSIDSMIVPFKNFINEAYSRDLSIKIRSSLKAKKEKGDFIKQNLPFGYVVDEKSKQYIVDESVRETIVKIFKWKIEGMSHEGIGKRLNKEGHLSPSEHKKSEHKKKKSHFQKYEKAMWSSVSARRVLENRTYTGAMVYGKTKRMDFKSKAVKMPKKEWTIVENMHGTIISKELFAIVEDLLLKDVIVVAGQTHAYLFSGILKCGDCENSMRRVSNENGRWIVYVCITHNVTKECSRHTTQDKELKDVVLAAIKERIDVVDDIKKELEILNIEMIKEKESAKIESKIKEEEEELKKGSQIKSTIYDDFTDGVVSKYDYGELIDYYDQQERQSQKKIKELYAEIESVERNLSPKSDWIKLFRKDRNTEILNRALLVTLVDEVRVFEDKRIKVVFRYEEVFEKIKIFIENHKQEKQR
ncbi:MAG: recombinase family protein [Alkaliphilus sp.]